MLVYNPRTGLFGPALDAAGIQVIFATPGMIMATVFVALPLVIREVVPVLEEIGDEQEQAARSLGANAVQTFRRITLPSIKWAVVYGVVLSLARSLGEFGAVKVVSGNIVQQTQTATLSSSRSTRASSRTPPTPPPSSSPPPRVICIVVVSLLRPKEDSHEHRDQGHQQEVRRLRRAGGRLADHPDRAAHRAARARPAAASRRCCGSSPASSPPTPAPCTIEGNEATHLPPQKRNVGFVFQHYAAFKHMSVAKNVAFGLEIRKRSKAETEKRVDELLELVHLSQFSHRLPSQLSGGQRQRMALARALAVEPTVLLLDEPFGALDAKVRKELRDWLRRLHDEVHVTTVFVTHDQEEALEVADEIVVINDGRIEQIGSPDQLYDEPANDFVMSFLGPVTTLDGQLIRPHDIDVLHDSARCAGRCRARSSGCCASGFEVRLTVELEEADHPDVEVTVTRATQRHLNLEEGMRVWIAHTNGARSQSPIRLVQR